jgi:O-glycosyl hydrolase
MAFHRFTRKAGVIALILLMLCVLALSTLLPGRKAYAASAAVTINGSTKYQTIDGFGFSEAFGEAAAMEQAPSSEQKQLLDLLLSPTTGAGFTILRNLLPSTSADTIEPNSPGSPTATPTYVPLGSSEGQIWLAQQAQSYGVKQFYGDALSAPGFMKTNGDEANGGTLCGAPGATLCSAGDWRQAYANYLVQYAKDYASAGIPLTEIGAFNEPTLSPSYSSMVMDPTQTADFVTVLGPTVQAAGVGAQIACCDAVGWPTAQTYTNGITSNATANASTNIFSGHGYAGAPTSALTGTGSKHVWETEWGDQHGSWTTAWDSGSAGSGFTWAQNIFTGLTAANLSAFFYWWGVDLAFNVTNNGILIEATNGTISVSSRLWAFANYSRYIHPGAVRIGSSSGNSNLEVASFSNSDGSVSIVVLNTAHSAITSSFTVQNTSITSGASAIPCVTNASNNAVVQTAIPVSNGAFTATVPARSLVTYTIQ